MRAFQISIEVPRGSLLVGGYSASSGGHDAVHAHRGKAGEGSRPIIPATTLRGALRETYEALLRGAGEGQSPCPSSGTEVAEACACAGCRMFGSGRSSVPAGMITPLVIEDAEISAEAAAPIWRTRDGVTIDRARRSAKEGLLFDRSIPEATGALRFVARGRFGVPELESHLQATVSATTHLGSGRSRGLGRVAMTLTWSEPGGEKVARRSDALPAGTDFAVVLELRSPTSIGVALPRSNMRETRSEIPGSALRGMLGWALAESGLSALEPLVGDGAGAVFDFCYPSATRPDERHSSAPLPLTARSCKIHRRKHGLVDTLFDRIAAKVVEELGARALDAGHLSDPQAAQCCAVCAREKSPDVPLKQERGPRSGAVAVLPKRVVTRLAMERSRSSAAEHKLFSHEMIDPSLAETGTPIRFAGSVRGVSPAARPLLERAFGEPLSVGRGHAHGWGRVALVASPLPAPAPMSKRAADFEKALAEHLRRSKLEPHLAERLVPFTLLSPLLIGDGGGDGSEAIASALGAELEGWFLKVRRFGVEVGWDQRRDRRQPRQSVVAGSIFVARLRGRTSREFLAQLDALEVSGAGERAKEGFGRILCFDPFFFARDQSKQRDEEALKGREEEMVKSRRETVLAAEKAIKGAPKRPEKSQVSSLVSVAREATCSEEIENWLRYQVGRKMWPEQLVDEMIRATRQLSTKADTDAARVAVWRDFSIYFVRAYTYEERSIAGGGRPR